MTHLPSGCLLHHVSDLHALTSAACACVAEGICVCLIQLWIAVSQREVTDADHAND